MTTPDHPESNLPPGRELPPPPGHEYTDMYSGNSGGSPSLPDRPSSGSQPIGRRSKPKRGIWAAVIVVVLAVAGVLAYNHFFSERSDDGIRSVMKAFTDDWNKPDVVGIRQLWCSSGVPDSNTLSRQVDRFGHIETSVRNINMSGDNATAEVAVNSSNAGGEIDTWSFFNEGGSWKVCKTNFIWDRVPGR
jgi:hypothetical protein